MTRIQVGSERSRGLVLENGQNLASPNRPCQSVFGQPASYQTKLCVVSGVKAIGVLGLEIFRSVTPQFRNQLQSAEVCYENVGQFSGFDYRMGQEICLFIKKSCPALKPAQISIRFETGAFRPGQGGVGKRPMGETDT